MKTLQSTIAEMTNTPDMIYVKKETMDKRKLVFLCKPGFEIHRENCGNKILCLLRLLTNW